MPGVLFLDEGSRPLFVTLASLACMVVFVTDVKEETQVLSHRADSTTSRESAPSFVYSMAEHTPPPATQGVVWLDDDGPASCASAPVRTVLIASSAVPAHHVPPTPHVDSDTVAPGGTEAVASAGMPVDRLGISVNSELGGGGGGPGGEPEESAYAGDAVQPASVHCAATATYTGAAPSFVYCTYEHVLCPDVQSAGGSATSEDTTDGPSCTHASNVPLHHAPGSPHVPTVKTAPAATLTSATEDLSLPLLATVHHRPLYATLRQHGPGLRGYPHRRCHPCWPSCPPPDSS